MSTVVRISTIFHRLLLQTAVVFAFNSVAFFCFQLLLDSRTFLLKNRQPSVFHFQSFYCFHQDCILLEKTIDNMLILLFVGFNISTAQLRNFIEIVLAGVALSTANGAIFLQTHVFHVVGVKTDGRVGDLFFEGGDVLLLLLNSFS